LTKLLPLTDFEARTNASNFGVKWSRSRWGQICPKCLFNLEIVTCWRRHNYSWQSHSHHLHCLKKVSL